MIAANTKELLGAFAGAVGPRAAVRVSAWAEKNITLPGSLTGRPGPFNPDYKPWTRDNLDARALHPGKRGVIALKPAQRGFTTDTLIKVLCAADTDPGPIYYMTTDREKAMQFSSVVLMGLVRQNPRLLRLFEDEVRDETQSSVLRSFPGGAVRFVGAGGGGAVTSWPERDVYLDEFELASDNFRAAGMGDLFQAVLPRTTTYKDTAWVEAFAHPNLADEGVDALYKQRSTRESWGFDCPRCGAFFAPLWEHVCAGAVNVSEAVDASGLDPSGAALKCPACGGVVHDHERRALVWPARLGGSGRYQGDGQYTHREFLGRWVHGLCDPAVSLAELVRAYAACATTEARQGFYALTLGEPYRLARGVLTLARVESAFRAMDSIVLPAPPRGAHFVTGGVDVQAPDVNPTLYTSLVAWSADGHAHAVAMLKVSGWTALYELLARAAFSLSGGGALEPSAVGVDCGAYTRQVLDACRQVVHTHGTGARVKLVPLRYEPYVKADRPFVMPQEVKRIDPARPYLGAQERYDLCREVFTDRAMRRWIDGRISVLCRPPEDLASHVRANVRRPKKDVHGNDKGEEWFKPKEFRDDWLQSLAYAEAVAVIDPALRLSLIHERAGPAPEEPPPPPRLGYWQRFTTPRY